MKKVNLLFFKTFCLLIGILFWSGTAFAQPANDDCANATPLVCNAPALVGETTVGAVAETTPLGCANDFGVWYTFMGDGSIATITSANNSFDHELVIFSSDGGCAGTFTQVVCDDQSTLAEAHSFLTVAGTEYFVYVAHFSSFGSTTTGTFDIELTCVSPPPNDDCANAIDLGAAEAGTCTGATAGTTVGTTESLPGCLGTANDDVWFSFIATGTDHDIEITNTAGTADIVTEVFDGCGGTSLECQDTPNSPINLTGLTVGNTYVFRVYSWSATATVTTDFTVCVGSPPAPPANDDCANATPLVCNGPALVGESTLGAIAETDPLGCANDFGVWYTFMGDGSFVTITSANNSFDHELDIFSSDGGCAGTFTQIVCDDQSTGAESHSFFTVAGTEYFVYVAHFSTFGSTTTGTFDIELTCVPPPANNDCATAEPLPVVEGDACGALTLGTNLAATPSGQLPAPSCSTFGTGEDIWYSVEVPPSGAVNIEVSSAGGPGDWAMSLYSGACGALTELQCSDDVNGLFPAITETGLTPGDILLVRLFEFGNDAIGEVNICAFAPAAVCDLNLDATASTDESCPGASDGTITLTGTTSFGPITYAITGPVDMTNTTGIFTDLPAGDYAFSLNDDGFPAAAGPCALTGGPITLGGDSEAPMITCPTPIVMDCDGFPTAANTLDEYLAQPGAALTDNCTIASISFGDMMDGDVCPSTAQRTLTRTYTATDDSGNSASCSYTIMTLNSVIGPVITEIPLDATITCASNAMPQMAAFNFDTDCGLEGTKSVEALPVIGSANCPGARYQFRYTAEDACGRIASHIQTYTVQNDAFELICPTVDCELDCGLSAEDAIAAFDAYTDNAIITSSCSNLGATISYNFNPASLGGCGSQTTVSFTATDPCGRSQNCASTVRVVDNTAPVISGLVPQTTRNCGSFATSDYRDWAENADSSVEIMNNCDNTYTWSYSPSTPNMENCGTGEISTTEVTFTVMDNCGNISYTTGQFLLKDAPVAANMIVSGHMRTESNETVELVKVNVSGSDGEAEVQTSENGFYTFELPVENNYTIVPSRNDNPLNGISTMDLIMISRHVLGVETLDSPYKLIAADVDKSGTITAFDMIELRKLILMINDEFPNNTSWRFVDGNYVFGNPMNPFAATFPTEYNINDLIDNMIADFVAIKVGDVNSSAVPSQLVAQGDSREGLNDLVFQVADRLLKANETYTVDFTAKDFKNVLGYQFTLDFDAAQLELVNYTSGDLKNLSADNFATRLGQGVLTSSWNLQEGASLADDAVLFSLTFKANTDVELSKAINLTSRLTTSEAYDQSGSLMNLALEFTAETGEAKFALLQNQPNPFSSQTLIGFTLPETSFATLTIYDVAGRTLKQYKGDFTKGYNEVSVSRSDLDATGVLFYKLETATETATMKMIVN